MPAEDIAMMDVSRLDLEEVLVDAANISGDLGDVSTNIESDDLDTIAEDKVLVSIWYNFPLALMLPLLLTCLQRMRPSSTTAWTSTTNTLKLTSSTTLTPSKTSTPTEYTYDNVLTGSENKPVLIIKWPKIMSVLLWMGITASFSHMDKLLLGRRSLWYACSYFRPLLLQFTFFMLDQWDWSHS